MTRPTRVLLVYPRFIAESFWAYKVSCEIVGAKHPTSPLGLITIAAMLPQTWEFRLVDRNIEDFAEGDLDWADIVLTGGMLVQQADALRVVDMAHDHGKVSMVGGPDVTSHPHVYESSDFRVYGEAESVIDDFVKACDPLAVDIEGDFNVRGNIKTVIRAAYRRDDQARQASSAN